MHLDETTRGLSDGEFQIQFSSKHIIKMTSCPRAVFSHLHQRGSLALSTQVCVKELKTKSGLNQISDSKILTLSLIQGSVQLKFYSSSHTIL